MTSVLMHCSLKECNEVFLLQIVDAPVLQCGSTFEMMQLFMLIRAGNNAIPVHIVYF